MNSQKLFLNSVLYYLVAFCLLSPCCIAVKAVGSDALPSNSQSLNEGRIAFSSYMSGSWQIWSIKPDGSDLTQLTRSGQEFHYPSWSGDGRQIVISGNERKLWILKTGGKASLGEPKAVQNLPPDCSYPAWSPVDDRIAFISYAFPNGNEDSAIWILNVATGKSQELINPMNIQSYPSWSPDGKRIVFTSGYRLNNTKIVEEIWVVNSDGSNAVPIVTDRTYNIQPSWSPDGGKIVFASNISGNMDIWVFDLKNNTPRRITSDGAYDADPSWSPDGSRICFTSTRSGRMEVWIMDSDGRHVRQLTGFSNIDAESMHPHWSK